MKRKLSIMFMIALTTFTLFACKGAEKKVYSGSVMVYTTFDETTINTIKTDFEDAYSGVVLDYFFGNMDSIEEKINMSFSLELPEADILLINSERDLQAFKNKSYLTPYTSKEDKKVVADYKAGQNGFYVVALNEDGSKNYVAVVSNSLNKENAELLIDYLLSKNCQKNLVNMGLKSVRNDVK